jgi:hypothetical protein
MESAIALFSLSRPDRDFVFSLLDLMNNYKSEGAVTKTTTMTQWVTEDSEHMSCREQRLILPSEELG